MKIVIEVLLLVILLVCIWNGYKKGLVMCIGTILAIILSLYVGDLLADTFSPAVKPAAKPFISGYMDGTDGVVSTSLNALLGGNAAGLSVDDAIKQQPELRLQLCEKSYEKVGIYSGTAKRMAAQAVEKADAEKITLQSALVDILCGAFTYLLSFLIFFLLSMIIITVIVNLVNLNLKLPGNERLNRIGGLVAGAVVGACFCFVAGWVLRFCGMFLPESGLKSTVLSLFFIRFNFLPYFLTV
ncbi:MAG: CvpA family protein [Oscillospiraceae bacterium]|jgi:uncharacterized membrane protein required for colicin V production